MTKFLISTLLGLLVVPLLALAAAGQRAEVLHFSGSGQAAGASFRSTDPSGCIVTAVELTAVDEWVKTDGVASERRSCHSSCLTESPPVALGD